MLMAHMDEVGLIVRRITSEGFLQVERLGGMGLRSLPGARLDLWTSDGRRLPAQVGTLPQHLDHTNFLPLESMYVEVGAASRKEAETMGVQVGDGLTWASSFERFGEHAVRGKAFDDRLGCFVLLELARYLTSIGTTPACDLHLAFVVQEESCLSGGLPAVRRYAPQIVIGIDGTLTFDTPDLAGQQNDVHLGGGPALKWLEAIRGKLVCTVPDWELANAIRDLARNSGIPLQDEVITGIGTALNPVPYANEGVRILGLSLPVRYHHSPVEMADLRDVQQMVELLTTLVQQSF
jgi:endoglucanase